VPRLLRLARLMHTTFDDVTLDAAGRHRLLETQVSSGELAEQLTISEVRLAHLLNLGSRLTLDLRRMPSLLAEHVGTDDVLSAAWLRTHLADAEWQVRATEGDRLGQGARWFDLKLDCANDAVDAALLLVVDALENYRTRLLQRQDIHATLMRSLLPAGFTANRLNSAPSGWHPTRPPLRFELDRTRIINLLMGQQLYGERWPALRELYQNALDACRYRRASEQLAVSEGRWRRGSIYVGQIAIRFGVSAGRRFIECVDNGVGMADRHIRRLFAYAGQRFVDSHEFHIDQARWDVAKVKFYPNSRFGVGVLSYFMLAEELDIVSRRWAAPTDFPSGPVRARIIGSGSLFRLESTIDPTRLSDDYGTSVRLYLREDAPDNNALRNSILDWLALPEMAVVLSEEGGEPLHLAAGQPTQSLSAACNGTLLAIPESEGTNGAARVFLAPSRSLEVGSRSTSFALVDGIRTRLAGEPWLHFLIVNLAEDLPKSLTVDRRSVSVNNETISTVEGWVRKRAGSVLAMWNDPDFAALHCTLRDLHPDAAAVADAALRASEEPSSTVVLPGSEVKWPIRNAGLSGIDPDIALDVLIASDIAIDEAWQLTDRSKAQQLGALVRLGLRQYSTSSIHPVTAAIMSSRASELSKAGVDFPGRLRHAVAFEQRGRVLSFPSACGPLVAELEGFGIIGAREVLRWTDLGHGPVLDAMQELISKFPDLIGFDVKNLSDLGPLHRRLCDLSSGSRLSWVEVAYFSQTEGLSLEHVNSIAKDLSNFGISTSDLVEAPEDIRLSEPELQLLSAFFQQEALSAHDGQTLLRRLRGYVESDRAPLDFGAAYAVLRLVERLAPRSDNANGGRPLGLDRPQGALLSEDFDDAAPYLPRLSTLHMFKASRNREFGSFVRVAEVARSLDPAIVPHGLASSLDDSLLAQIDKITLTDGASKIVGRLFDAVDRGRPTSVWDLALAATAAKLDLDALQPFLSFLANCDGDVGACREFVTYCRRS
jgi:hypothetical protein